LGLSKERENLACMPKVDLEGGVVLASLSNDKIQGKMRYSVPSLLFVE